MQNVKKGILYTCNLGSVWYFYNEFPLPIRYPGGHDAGPTLQSNIFCHLVRATTHSSSETYLFLREGIFVHCKSWKYYYSVARKWMHWKKIYDLHPYALSTVYVCLHWPIQIHIPKLNFKFLETVTRLIDNDNEITVDRRSILHLGWCHKSSVPFCRSKSI